jgi:RNA helicase HrpA
MSPTLSIKCDYPDLPVVKRRQEFLELLKKHQVIIVQADTGSGKSTQLPKMLLESGLSLKGKIGVTQPRRLAALSIADRLREELKDETLVSSKIRFYEEGPENAPLKVMTDGILLQEFRKDRLFTQYSAIMIDEAHERSLNIDILLGILKQVLKKRSDFRLVIASATMDSALFKDFFENSVLLEAEGRMFPVTVEYRDPFEGENSSKGDSGVLEDALEAILDLETRNRDNLLCFLPTERDIQDLGNLLQKELDDKFEILSLFGRMSPAEQKKVFRSTSKTRIVLATNIAETSLTIPGIAYVVDSGTARISRYNAQARIQGLPVEEISQASARQRTGRAGRVKPGVCIRLYSEKNFLERDAYTEPEIRRSNLANVVLQLRSLGISIDEFEFIQSPLRSAFRGAYRTLFELGALSSADANAEVTPFGREMSKLPMDVALSAVLLRSREKGVLQPAIIVCAALSLQDVRLIPQEETEKQKAREIHKQFGKYKSDFLLYIVIWNSFILELGEGSLNKLRKYCEKKYLHFLRCREWIDLYEQYCRLLNVGFQERVCPLESFHRDNLHLSLLYGFLGGIAKRSQEKSSYQLVSGRETFIFPGSSLYGQNMEWLMSAEIRETSRVYLTKNAEIRPEWILIAGKLFCTKRYYAPTWNRERGFVDALEEILFRGMVVSRGKRVDYSKINPAECSEIFFREAVVNMDMLRPFPFMEHNEKFLETLASMEKRLRRFGLVPSEDWLVDFYISKTENVCSIKSLKEFILKNTDESLRLKESDFVQEFSDFKTPSEKFSNKLSLKTPSSKHSQKVKPELGGALETVRILDRILYGELVFDASRSCDGLTLKIPVEMLQKLTPAIFALEIERWRTWILESFFKELPREVSKKAKEIREKIDDVFCEFLEKEKEVSPVVALSKVIKQFGFLKNESCLIYPEKEKHLNLHLSVMLSDGSTESIELSPEWGNYHYVQALKHLLSKEILFLPFGTFYLLYRNQKLAVVEKAEKDFYQKLKTRIQNKLHPENTTLALDRISLLENCGAKIASQSNPSAKEEIISALIASDWNPAQTERFSGLEFAKANRIKSFKDLSPELQSEDFVLRAGLSRLCYESALLGGKYFTPLWNYLRQVTKSMRQGQKISAELKRLANAVLNANSVYEILSLGIEFGKTEGLWQKEILELEHSSAYPIKNLTVKDLREEFRPFLQSRLLREEDRRKVRDILFALEKTEIESEEYIERYIMAKILFEKYSAKSIQKEEDMEIESIEQASLEKLKNRFGKI